LSSFVIKPLRNGIKHRQMLKEFIALCPAQLDESQQADAYNELF